MNAFVSSQQVLRYIIGLAIWLLGWCLLLFFDTHFDPVNLSLILVLTSALAALWLPLSVTLLASVAALFAFNWTFVPPRGTFAIDLHQHTVLLVAMMLVNIIIAGLMVFLREQSRRARAYAQAAEELRVWGDKLRDASEPELLLNDLQLALKHLSSNQPVVLAALEGQLPSTNNPAFLRCIGSVNPEQEEALWHCLRSGQALGPGTGRYQELDAIYLPLRGRGITSGAAMIAGITSAEEFPELIQAQALCDQMGAALERQYIQQQERQARDQAQAQTLRSTLLAAISHDYRTPLATIMGAASSLDQQGERLSDGQRQQLARSIVDEADRLRRLTSNILQLARLDAIAGKIQGDWESAEEIVGSVMRRMRSHDPQQRLCVTLEPDLPLLWGDSLLLSQLLENLIDNAFKYSPPESPITVSVHLDKSYLVLAVRDQGTGIAAADYEQIFDVFQRGDQHKPGGAGGAGIGLALCRAIARAHGGELEFHTTSAGVSFECHLPLRTQPDNPETEL
ncbi:sensor histidine kinase [Cellvibrio fontiphilus]|jgi:two-component system sensor histidine kinase KdpD|uniref:histidine kinase n=1 Tax=Cellvibrio fontiphilus TaxID=1815559 RepID=A0ABV7F9B0_9GAMM